MNIALREGDHDAQFAKTPVDFAVKLGDHTHAILQGVQVAARRQHQRIIAEAFEHDLRRWVVHHARMRSHDIEQGLYWPSDIADLCPYSKLASERAVITTQRS